MKESEKFKPIGNIRAHHFLQEAVQLAFTKRRSPQETTAYYFACIGAYTFINPEYERDIRGDSGKEMSAAYNNYVDTFSKLRNFPNRSYISISSEEDDMCNSCIVGQHCNSTSYPFSGTIINAPAENTNVVYIKNLLIQARYEEGKHFISEIIPRTYYDLKGKSLGGPEKGTPREYETLRLIAETGALRKVATGLLSKKNKKMDTLIPM